MKKLKKWTQLFPLTAHLAAAYLFTSNYDFWRDVSTKVTSS